MTKRHKCPTCKSVGFEISTLGKHRCTFCDGTEGGCPPTIKEIENNHRSADTDEYEEHPQTRGY